MILWKSYLEAVDKFASEKSSLKVYSLLHSEETPSVVIQLQLTWPETNAGLLS
jgi:hypothetical protein